MATQLIFGDAPYSAGPDPVAINTVISRFPVMGKLGMAGMGVVYRAAKTFLWAAEWR